jgi:FixJ family two-component response regulator
MEDKPDTASALQGARVIVIEDDFIIATELQAILLSGGADKVNLYRSVKEALTAADDGCVAVAILDIRLGRESVAPVARRLSDQGIPFVFYTGQPDSDPILAEWPESKVLAKPAAPQTIIIALSQALKTGAAAGATKRVRA